MANVDYERLTGNLRRTAILVVAILVLAAGLLWVGTYGLRRLVERRVAQREAKVVRTLRTMSEALLAYEQKYGGYPNTLERLRGKEDGPASYLPPERARLLETPLARDRFEQHGYRFTYTPTGAGQTWAATVPLVSGYVLEARPAGRAGSRTSFYYADQTRAVRVRRGAPAGPEDPLVPPSP
ncbi:MAG: hypothetical protein ACE5MH_01195 [Terriglobia bacterium]